MGIVEEILEDAVDTLIDNKQNNGEHKPLTKARHRAFFILALISALAACALLFITIFYRSQFSDKSNFVIMGFLIGTSCTAVFFLILGIVTRKYYKECEEYTRILEEDEELIKAHKAGKPNSNDVK